MNNKIPAYLRPMPIGEINIERFFSKISVCKETDCWSWNGCKSGGYGRFNVEGKIFLAHRVSFVVFGGVLIRGLLIDHTCRNKACVNPSHLRQVSFKTNVTENSNSVSAINSKKTSCINGHDFKAFPPVIRAKGYRACRECMRLKWIKPSNKPINFINGTHCINGHEYSKTGSRKVKNRKSTCRACYQIYYQKTKGNKKRGIDAV